MGNELDPTNYGWIIGEDDRYSPDMGVKDICPKAILKIIHCNCTKGCTTNACGCRKLNILCTISCNCEDNNTCNNNNVVRSLDQDSEDEDCCIDEHELHDERVPSETESDSDW